MDKCKEVERSIITKFRPTIWRLFLRGIDEYKLISEGDKIAVCVSGGKDSMLLAKCMQELLAHGDVKFEVDLETGAMYQEYLDNKNNSAVFKLEDNDLIVESENKV